MVRMRAPYTGAVYQVAEKNVARKEKLGWVALEAYDPPTEDADEPDPEPEEHPDESWTAAEIRKWAKARGVKVPNSSKAEMIAAIEAAG